jgi:hypothetical protein
VEGEFCESIFSILYETTSINFLGSSQAAFQSSVAYHISWCRIKIRIVAYGPPRGRGGLGKAGLVETREPHTSIGSGRAGTGAGASTHPCPRHRKLPDQRPTLIHDALRLLKSALHTFVADERLLQGPEDLTGKTTAQIGLYAHRAQDSRTSKKRPRVVTPANPRPRISVLRWVPHIGLSASSPVRDIWWSAFWALSVRSGRLRRSTGALCTVLRMDFCEHPFHALR